MIQAINIYSQHLWNLKEYLYHDSSHFIEQNRMNEVKYYNRLSKKNNLEEFKKKYSDGLVQTFRFNKNNKIFLLIETQHDTSYISQSNYYYTSTGKIDSIAIFIRLEDGKEKRYFHKYIYENDKLKKIIRDNNVYIFRYDTLGRLVERIFDNKEEYWDINCHVKKDKKIVTINLDSTIIYKYIYNEKGKLIKKIKPKGYANFFYFNNKLIQITSYGEQYNKLKSDFVYIYNSFGEIEYIKSCFVPDIRRYFMFEFNSNGLPIKETLYYYCKYSAPEECAQILKVNYEYKFFESTR
jgi:hypothetical protein